MALYLKPREHFKAFLESNIVAKKARNNLTGNKLLMDALLCAVQKKKILAKYKSNVKFLLN